MFVVVPVLTRIVKEKRKKRGNTAGGLLELDTALTQLVNLPKAFFLLRYRYHQGRGHGLQAQPVRSDVTAVTSERERRERGLVGSVKRRRSQAGSGESRENGRRYRGDEAKGTKPSERRALTLPEMAEGEGKEELRERRERERASAPTACARLSSFRLWLLHQLLGFRGAADSQCRPKAPIEGPRFVMLGDPGPISPLHKRI